MQQLSDVGPQTAAAATAAGATASTTESRSDDYNVGDRVKVNYNKRRVFLGATVTEVDATSTMMKVRIDAESDESPSHSGSETYVVTNRFDKTEVTPHEGRFYSQNPVKHRC